MYYLTVYNDPYQQPKEPEGLDVDGLLRGLYRYAQAAGGPGPRAQILASGVAMPWALEAQTLLAQEWGVQADVWSATSWGELRRDGVECESHNLAHPEAEPRVPYLSRALADAAGPVVAVSDWMRAVPDLVRKWVPQDYTVLGTDGFGLSDTRPAVRRHFGVDAANIAVATLAALARRGEVDVETVTRAAARYEIDDPQAAGPQTSDSGVA